MDHRDVTPSNGHAGPQPHRAGWQIYAENLKLIGDALQPFVIIVSAAAAVLTFVVTENQKRQDRIDELSSPYYAKQLDLYLESAGVAAHLASSGPNDPDHDKNIARFWELYWGQLGFVESPKVEALMVEVCRQYVSAEHTDACTKPASDPHGTALNLARRESEEIRARWETHGGMKP